MLAMFRRRSKKAGLPPGTLVHVGEKKTDKVKVTVTGYKEAEFGEREVETIEECFPFNQRWNVTWVNIDGIHQVEVVEKVGKHLGIHPLVLEDIVNAGHQPKMEDFEDYLFVIVKMISYDEEQNQIIPEQVSLLIGPNYVVTFQEREGDVFETLRERIRKGKGRIRKMNADYLAYAIIDTIVDHYFVVLEKLDDKIEGLEEELISNPSPETLHTIHAMKRELISLRRAVWPLRAAVNNLERGESPLIHESTAIYLKDVHDHTIHVIDTVEGFRDMVSGMMDVYLSSVSNKMNEVMKVLTIIATIFIPLTFIAGVYGMNFKYIPELEWPFGYPLSLLVMLAVGLAMVLYFRKKSWL